MPDAAANELVDFLQEQAGEYLRGAIHYSHDDYEVLFMRADVADRYSSADLQTQFEYFRGENRDQTAAEAFDLGTNHCTVDFYDDAILFHFTQGEDVGTVITMDPAAGRDIVQFITRCIAQLHRNTPQEIGSAPDWIER